MQLLNCQWLAYIHSGFCTFSEMAMVEMSSCRFLCKVWIGSGWNVFFQAVMKLLNWQRLVCLYSGFCERLN